MDVNEMINVFEQCANRYRVFERAHEAAKELAAKMATVSDIELKAAQLRQEVSELERQRSEALSQLEDTRLQIQREVDRIKEEANAQIAAARKAAEDAERDARRRTDAAKARVEAAQRDADERVKQLESVHLDLEAKVRELRQEAARLAELASKVGG